MKCINCGQELMKGAVFCPYCGIKTAGEITDGDRPVYQTEVRGMHRSGTLSVYCDRTEYATSSIQKTVYEYAGLAAVKKRMGVGTALGFGVDHIDFITEGGTTESCPVNRKDVHEAFLRIKEVVDPYLAKRKERLLAQGIFLSGFCSCGGEKGVLNMLEDRVEFVFNAGSRTVVPFRDIRIVNLLMGTLELALTDGTSISFAVEKDMQDQMFAFVREAVSPYVQKRTVGFDTSFGMDERIEVNGERGVFHILRQEDRAITEEVCLTDLVSCGRIEEVSSKSALGLFAGAAKAVGVQEKLGAPDAENVISCAGVELTVRTERGTQTELVRFGDFSMGMSRNNKKYNQYLAEIERFMNYLEERYPDCELILPILPEPELKLLKTAEDDMAKEAEGSSVEWTETAVGNNNAEKPETVKEDIGAEEPRIVSPEAPVTFDAVSEMEQLGIKKYIEGVSGFIDSCRTPMTIAVQGSWESGKSSIMKALYESLKERYADRRIWFNPRPLFHSCSEEPLTVRVGKELVRRLSGEETRPSRDSAVKIAKGVIELLAGAIAPESSAGQNLVEGLFQDGTAIPSEKVVEVFSGLVKKRAGGPDGKVIVLIDELDRLAPAKVLEMLDALRSYFDCEGCVFVAAIDYSIFRRGIAETPNMNLDERQEKVLFDEIFQMTFRVPVSGLQIKNYVGDKLEHMGIFVEDAAELDFYTDLITHSVDSGPKNMDRLFNSFLLIKNMADRELYEDRIQRLMLFALLCMQTGFHAAYEQLKQMKDEVTPEFLSRLCSEESEVVIRSQLRDGEKKKFITFAKVICDIIDTDDREDISQSECGVFTRVLEFSSITSK